jgi:hypothetical protein
MDVTNSRMGAQIIKTICFFKDRNPTYSCPSLCDLVVLKLTETGDKGGERGEKYGNQCRHFSAGERKPEG